MAGRSSLSHFMTLLNAAPSAGGVFNPWKDLDRRYDISEDAPLIREEQLRHYLESRLDSARYLIIGEAIGYQGGRFTGIAMTSERILLGYQRDRGIHPEHVLPGLVPRRTSRPEICPRGFAEPTATIVWGTLLNQGMSPDRFVLWNAFPRHPYNPEKGPLSNRRPRAREMYTCLPILERFIELFPGARIVAMGKLARESLEGLNMDFRPVRHPAQGGAVKFRDGIADFLKNRLKT